MSIWRACFNCGEPFTGLQQIEGWKFCSALCRKPLSRISYAHCVICKKLFVRHGRGSAHKATCSDRCSADYAAARHRARDYMRRCDESDITPEQEAAMRKRARKCPLCHVKLTSKHHLPSSKHLDHILPRNQGGTHTHGNVRIICQTCNLKRPKDGSDFTGQLTLWAQLPNVVSRKRTMCRAGLHPYVKGGCKACRKTQPYEAKRSKRSKPPKQCKCGASFVARGDQFMCPACIDAAAHKAAELHASGLTWKQVAAEVGYGSHNGEGARNAAMRIGYRPMPTARAFAAEDAVRVRRASVAAGRSAGAHVRSLRHGQGVAGRRAIPGWRDIGGDRQVHRLHEQDRRYEPDEDSRRDQYAHGQAVKNR